MNNFKIGKLEYHQRQGFGIGGAWKDSPIWVAEVEAQGHKLGFSRFDTESDWFCDYHFSAKGFPVFCHGEGSRSCAKQIAKGDLKNQLDALKANHSGELKKAFGVA